VRSDDGFGMWWEGLMIRSLLRTEQHQEALRMATMSTARDDDRYFEVLAYAAMGNVNATIDAMRSCLDWGYSADDFYLDDDAGPALQAEAFAPLRERFPAGEGEAFAQELP